MGSGRWSDATYSDYMTTTRSAGKSTFAYSDTSKATTPSSSWKAHDSLDPKNVKIRESRDSNEHPNSLAIAVLFDVTGSMHTVPRELQDKLGTLFGLLLRKGYVEDPQIMFGAIGDATSDRVPLQAGQFESDNRLDENLSNIFLEGNGGGQVRESYELAMYFMARHTATDCWEKRGHKGYVFIIGDENAYSTVKTREVENIIGDVLTESIPLAVILSELQEKFNVYYIEPKGGSYWNDPKQESFWRNLLGQNYIRVEETDAITETIALTIGLSEGTVDLEDGLSDLEEVGSKAGKVVGRALATVGAGSLAVSESNLPDLGSSGDTARL